MGIYEKQCEVCGLIWEDTKPIRQEPFICPNCRRQMKHQEESQLSKARKTLKINKEKYKGE